MTVNTLLIVAGLLVLGMATVGVSFPRFNTLAGGLLLICLGQYAQPILASLH